MDKTIEVELTTKSINKAVRELRKYKHWVETKERELRFRLAQRGATVASIRFSRAIYNGSSAITVRVVDTGSVAIIYADGKEVAFVEFGSGAKYGYGHPQAAELGVGPGTYPEGKGHWDDPNGWWYGHGQHSYGNPPAMAMCDAVQAITEQVTTIAKEVFASA